jgi:hypothetical protein
MISPTYRTGNHWGRTLVQIGTGPEDAHGRRPDDTIVGLLDSASLAAQVVQALNGRPRCLQPNCPDYGDVEFGEGACPSDHAAGPR